jgi:hypothetical protein
VPTSETPARDRPHPAAVVSLVVLVALIALALATSERSGTGARDVGVRDGSTPAAVTGTACPPSVTNPGGRNNYRRDAPFTPVLGHGLVITGTVRGTDCRPLAGVRVQAWTQTATAGERDNVSSVLTAADGTFRVDSDPPRAQFGEPNVHVAYDDDVYRPVFLRNVVRADDTLAVVDLTLVPAG